MEIIKDIAAIIGCILSVVSLVGICTKGGRSFIKQIFLKNTKELAEQNLKQNQDIAEIKETLNKLLDKTDALEEISAQQCRDSIANIYSTYVSRQALPAYQRNAADRTYRIYHERFGGNSYASLLYEEIRKWHVEPDNNPHV